MSRWPRNGYLYSHRVCLVLYLSIVCAVRFFGLFISELQRLLQFTPLSHDVNKNDQKVDKPVDLQQNKTNQCVLLTPSLDLPLPNLQVAPPRTASLILNYFAHIDTTNTAYPFSSTILAKYQTQIRKDSNKWQTLLQARADVVRPTASIKRSQAVGFDVKKHTMGEIWKPSAMNELTALGFTSDSQAYNLQVVCYWTGPETKFINAKHEHYSRYGRTKRINRFFAQRSWLWINHVIDTSVFVRDAVDTIYWLKIGKHRIGFTVMYGNSWIDFASENCKFVKVGKHNFRPKAKKQAGFCFFECVFYAIFSVFWSVASEFSTGIKATRVSNPFCMLDFAGSGHTTCWTCFEQDIPCIFKEPTARCASLVRHYENKDQFHQNLTFVIFYVYVYIML